MIIYSGLAGLVFALTAMYVAERGDIVCFCGSSCIHMDFTCMDHLGIIGITHIGMVILVSLTCHSW